MLGGDGVDHGVERLTFRTARDRGGVPWRVDDASVLGYLAHSRAEAYGDVVVDSDRGDVGHALLGLTGLADVTLVSVDAGDVVLDAGGERYDVRVEVSVGAPSRQSCADLKTKPTPVYRVESVSRR
jgi:hypothetical protein